MSEHQRITKPFLLRGVILFAILLAGSFHKKAHFEAAAVAPALTESATVSASIVDAGEKMSAAKTVEMAN